MTTTAELLRETFAAEASDISMPPQTRARVEVLVRRHRARRAATIAGAAVAAIAFAVAIPAAVSSFDSTPSNTGVAAASASYDSWAPRGGLGDDASFAATAIAAWDAAAPHTDVQVLWADVFATGRGAVLTATDLDGDRRLAVVAGGTPSLKLLRDVAAPAELTHLSFNLFTDDDQHSDTSYRDTLVVITPPASGWTVEWAGGTDPADGAGTARTEDGVAVIDISESGWQGRPTIRLIDGSTVIYEGPIGTQT